MKMENSHNVLMEIKKGSDFNFDFILNMAINWNRASGDCQHYVWVLLENSAEKKWMELKGKPVV